MTNNLSAEEVCALLGSRLTPSAASCASDLSATNELHPAGSQHRFLMAGRQGRTVFRSSRRCDFIASGNDQLYHRYVGDPIEILMLHENGTCERVVVGSDSRRPLRAVFDPGQYVPLHASSDDDAGSSARAQNGPA